MVSQSIQAALLSNGYIQALMLVSVVGVELRTQVVSLLMSISVMNTGFQVSTSIKSNAWNLSMPVNGMFFYLAALCMACAFLQSVSLSSTRFEQSHEIRT